MPHKNFQLLFIAIFTLSMACNNAEQQIDRVKAKADSINPVAEKGTKKTILFYGNSLTAGYGLEDPTFAFPSLIQKRIDSLRLPYEVINAGVSGETSSGGNSRVDWILKQPVDIFILELGANDGLRGIPFTETAKNLQSIIDKVKAKNKEVKIILAGMLVPPNMGPDYSKAFKELFPALAKKNATPFIPFILEGVAGEEKLNQGDGIHPTAEGHRMVMENVWNVLKDNL
ncbi:MAG: arylesterase [Chitinophagaceae bacterium]